MPHFHLYTIFSLLLFSLINALPPRVLPILLFSIFNPVLFFVTYIFFHLPSHNTIFLFLLPYYRAQVSYLLFTQFFLNFLSSTPPQPISSLRSLSHFSTPYSSYSFLPYFACSSFSSSPLLPFFILFFL